MRRIFLLVAVLFGASYAWAGRYVMFDDGIAYLDMADAYLRGDWNAAVSSAWSPLYSWLLALGLSVVNPTPPWEFPAVHLINFAIYLGALASFDFFIRQLLRYRREYAGSVSLEERVRLPEWAFLAAGYMLFIWSSLNLIGVSLVAPHMTMAALVFLATGLLLRIHVHPEGWHSFVLLGIVLGLAYLARSSMFFLALVFLGLAMLSGSGNSRARGPLLRAVVALSVFLVVAGAYAIPLFVIKGRPPLGDLPRLNYAWSVNRVPQIHWQGEPPGSGTPRHPTRRLFAKPAVFEFAGPIGGTYPVWYDPSYWYEGVTPRFDPAGHVKVLVSVASRKNVSEGVLHFLPRGGAVHYIPYLWLPSVVICALVGYYAQHRGWLSWGDVTKYKNLFVPSAAAFAQYFLLSPRAQYIGGVVPLVWLGVLSSVAIPAGPGAKRTGAGLAIAVLVLHGMFTVPGTLAKAYSVTVGGVFSSNIQWQVADGLRQMGIRPGGKVAVIGTGGAAYWARLARVQIIAEITGGAIGDFWASDEHVRQLIMGRLATVGAEVVVVSPRARPPHADASGDLNAVGWQRIGKTDYYAFVLKR